MRHHLPFEKHEHKPRLSKHGERALFDDFELELLDARRVLAQRARCHDFSDKADLASNERDKRADNNRMRANAYSLVVIIAPDIIKVDDMRMVQLHKIA